MNTEKALKTREGGLMDVNDIRMRITAMADKVCGMLGLIEKGFMENKMEFLSEAMKEEGELNKEEKLLTKSIIDVSKMSRAKKTLSAFAQIIEELERMGDEAANLIERIEIKVHEKLLFSEEGVEQFNETYHAMKRSVEMMRDSLENSDPASKQKIVDNGFHVKELVERYRQVHADRLVQGECTPLGANMYFDMLDFTGNLARHASNIVKLG